MKEIYSYLRLGLLTSMSVFASLCVGLAGDTNSGSPDATASQPAAAPASTAVTAPAPTKLPYGVEDVLKLTHAQISEEIILNYVRNSGTIYNLSPQDIVYLRDQGVSEKVVNAMLDQRTQVQQAAQSAPAPVSGIPNAPTVANAPSVPEASSVAVAPTYITTPATPSASSVTVIPYPAATYAYYGPYGYYYPYSYPYYYGGWYGPSVSFAFGFGGHGCYYGPRYYGRGYYGWHH